MKRLRSRSDFRFEVIDGIIVRSSGPRDLPRFEWHLGRDEGKHGGRVRRLRQPEREEPAGCVAPGQGRGVGMIGDIIHYEKNDQVSIKFDGLSLENGYIVFWLEGQIIFRTKERGHLSVVGLIFLSEGNP